MTFDQEPATRIRPRLTGAPGATRISADALLSAEACEGVKRVAGGRQLEELVVAAAATLLMVAAMEHTDKPAVVVAGPRGRTVIGADLNELRTFADVVRAADTALRTPGAENVDVDVSKAVAVGSGHLGSPACDKPAAIGITMTMSLDGSAAELNIDADPAVAEEWFVRVLLSSMGQILSALRQPRVAIGEVQFTASDDRSLVEGFAVEYFQPGAGRETLTESIAQFAASTPDAVAVVCGDQTLDYGQVWRRARAVAARLAARGIGSGDRVAVLTGKTPDSIPVILGVLLARAAYVPLDPRWPATRINSILDDIGDGVVIADRALRDRLADASTAAVLDAEDLCDTAQQSDGFSLDGPTGDDLAYIVYTSGSTGIPKGVPIRHRAIASYMDWKIGYHQLGGDTRLLQTASLAVDGGTSDIFSVLGAGGSLVLVDTPATVGRELGELARQHRITDINTVPSLYRVIVDELATAAEHVRLVTLGGEATTTDLVKRHYDVLPNARLVNEYGPTECSIAATAFDQDINAGPGCPIGRPIDNTVVAVADADGRRRPVGFVGELRLAGEGLAEGYRNRRELTAEVFVADDTVPGGRAYRSGDLGWWRPDGMLEFVGRNDNQVKVRGQRVELGEVESIMGRVPGVKAIAVIAAKDPEGALGLVAFAEGGEDLTVTYLRESASDCLAPSMVPARLEVVDGLPRIANGKPDRAKLADRAEQLLAAAQAGLNNTGAEAALSGVEGAVAEVFAEVFGGGNIGAQDDFFALGGHSLLAVSVIGKLEERFKVTLDLDDFLDAATVEKVAELLGDCETEAAAQTPLRPTIQATESDSLLNLIAETEAEEVTTEAGSGDLTVRLRQLFATALELELDVVTEDTDFFLAGGHSLSALTLAVAVEREFDVEVKVRDIFDAATPELLAVHIAEVTATTDIDTPSAETRQSGPETEPTGTVGEPVSAETRWLWLERQRGEIPAAAYTIPCLLQVEGVMDVERLRSAVTALAERHQMLRTAFAEHQGQPRAVPAQPVTLSVTDVPDPDTAAEEFQSVVNGIVDRPFELETGPLVRIVALRHAKWSLLIVADHLVCDGRSLVVLAEDLATAYRDHSALPSPSSPGQLSADDSRSALAYWRTRLEPLPEPLALPVFAERGGPVATTATVTCEVEPSTVTALHEHARAAHAGVFGSFAAGTVLALSELTGTDDVCVGTPVDRSVQLGRPREVECSVATVPLRVRIPADRDKLVSAVAGATMDALDNSGVSFGELVAELDPPRQAGRHPFFDVWVALYPRVEAGDTEQGGIALHGGPLPLRYGMFELSFQFVEHADGIRLLTQFDVDRYDIDTVTRLAARVCDCLGSLAAGNEDADSSGSHAAVFDGFRFD